MKLVSMAVAAAMVASGVFGTYSTQAQAGTGMSKGATTPRPTSPTSPTRESSNEQTSPTANSGTRNDLKKKQTASDGVEPTKYPNTEGRYFVYVGPKYEWREDSTATLRAKLDTARGELKALKASFDQLTKQLAETNSANFEARYDSPQESKAKEAFLQLYKKHPEEFKLIHQQLTTQNEQRANELTDSMHALHAQLEQTHKQINFLEAEIRSMRHGLEIHEAQDRQLKVHEDYFRTFDTHPGTWGTQANPLTADKIDPAEVIARSEQKIKKLTAEHSALAMTIELNKNVLFDIQQNAKIQKKPWLKDSRFYAKDFDPTTLSFDPAQGRKIHEEFKVYSRKIEELTRKINKDTSEFETLGKEIRLLTTELRELKNPENVDSETDEAVAKALSFDLTELTPKSAPKNGAKR